MQASNVSKSPDSNNRRERNDEVSGQQDGKHREDYRVGKQELKERKTVQFSATSGGKRQWCLGGEEPIVQSYVWQNDVKASVNKNWQVSQLCHMLLVKAVVLDGTKYGNSRLIS